MTRERNVIYRQNMTDFTPKNISWQSVLRTLYYRCTWYTEGETNNMTFREIRKAFWFYTTGIRGEI